MSISGFLISIEPFDGTIAIAGNKIVNCDWFPSERGAWESTHTRCVINGLYFSLINIVNFHLAIGATDTYYLIIDIDSHGEYFCTDISKEIDYSSCAECAIGEFYLSRAEVFILFDVFLLMENVIDFFEGDGLGLLIMLIHLNNILDCLIEWIINPMSHLYSSGRLHGLINMLTNRKTIVTKGKKYDCWKDI